MNERHRTRSPNERPGPDGLGNPFALGGDAGSAVIIEYGVYRERLPLAGRTIAEIRRIVGPRYDIDRRAGSTLDARDASEDTVVRAGQELRFLHLSGEKGQGGLPLDDPLGGAAGLLLRRALGLRRGLARCTPAPRVTIEGDLASLVSPEGATTTLGLEDLLAHFDRGGPAARRMRDVVLPDGVRWSDSRGECTVLIHETPPAVRKLRWIAADSPPYGPRALYREVRIALPYVIVLATFEPGRDGEIRLGDRNECFFRRTPLRSPDDPLLYPALLNCSRFDHPIKPLSWICTQHLVRTTLPAGAATHERVWRGLSDLLRGLLEMGFNYSSEEHEVSSWFTESTGVDPRVATIERWEAATRADPLFACDVPWLPVGASVRKVVDRALTLCAGRGDRPRTSRDLAQVLQHRGAAGKTAGQERDT